MSPTQLAQIRGLVASAGEEIQPKLHPHPGLAERNAYAHIWLGVKTTFGEGWREHAKCEEVCAFIDWVRRCPNDDYGDYPGAVTKCAQGIPEKGLFE